MDVAEVEALVHELASALRARGWLLVTAESCTGGLVAAACTAVAGSSVATRLATLTGTVRTPTA